MNSIASDRAQTGVTEAASGSARTGGTGDSLVCASALAPKFLAPGWVVDESGALKRETIHRMGRRCRNWDYRGKAVYLITIEAAERGRGIFGRVVTEAASGSARTGGIGDSLVCASASVKEAVCASALAPKFLPNALGEIIAREWARLAEAWGVELLASQVMEDHFHGILATPSFMAKPLGAIVGSFKARASSEAGRSLWAKGYVDTILGGEEAVEKAIAYVEDNPRRLAIKRANPDLFKVLRELKVEGLGRFSAIGNAFLLDLPRIVQVQCSRRDFAYARDAAGKIAREKPPRLKTAAFEAKLTALRGEIAHGAAIISPCISEGERELARAAFAEGTRVITLSNKGFSPLYKPGGKFFDACADGRLLMLAPINWPYQPGEKAINRASAVALNRIAQIIAKDGAAKIDYKGVQVVDVDAIVKEAVL